MRFLLITLVALAQDGNWFTDADKAYAARADQAQAERALTLYKAELEKHPENEVAHWRVSMAEYFWGLKYEKDSDKKKAHFENGRDVAEKAIALKETCAECHFWFSINTALYGQEVGIFKTLFSIRKIENHIHRSIELDPKYAGAAGYRLLGSIEEAVPGILGGSDKKALEWFKKAMETAPEEPLNYLMAAKILREEFDDDKEALNLVKRSAGAIATCREI